MNTTRVRPKHPPYHNLARAPSEQARPTRRTVRPRTCYHLCAVAAPQATPAPWRLDGLLLCRPRAASGVTTPARTIPNVDGMPSFINKVKSRLKKKQQRHDICIYSAYAHHCMFGATIVRSNMLFALGESRIAVRRDAVHLLIHRTNNKTKETDI